MNNRTLKELIEENEQLKKQLKEVSLINTNAFESPQEREKKFQNVFEKSSDALLIIENNIFTDCNIATSKMLGYATKKEFLSLHPSKLSPIVQPDGQDSFIKAEEMMRLAYEKGSHRFEWIHTKKNGSNFPVEVLLTVIKDEPNNKTIYCVWRDITDRKESDNKLAKSIKQLQNEKDRIKTILNLVGDPIFVKDNDHKIIFANSAFCNMVCLDENSVIGKTLVDSGLNEETQHFFKMDREVLDTGIPNLCEERLTIGDKTRTIITKKTRFINESGDRCLVGSIHDITERKKVEEKLLKSEYMLSESQRIANIGGWSWPFSGPINWTDETYHVYGVSPETFTPTIESLVNLIHPEDRQLMQHWIEDCMVGKNIGELVFRTIQPDGSIRILSGNGELIYDSVKKPIMISGTVQDITERKQAEDDLKRSEQILKLFVKHAPAAVAMFDKEMKYIVANDRFYEDYKLGDKKIIGHSHYEIFPEIPERWRKIHKHCLEGAILKDDKDSFLRMGGKLEWLRWEIHPWYERDGEIGGIIIFSEMITERKKAEEALKASQQNYYSLFNDSPIPIWEEDFSEVKTFIDALKKKGVKDFRNYFNNRPETVKECIKMLKILNVNKPVLELHEANTKEDLLEGLSKIFTKKSLVALKEQLIAIAENTKKFNLETETKTLKGNKKMIHLEWIVVPGYEESMEKVILCTTDITEIKKYRLHLETLVKKRTAELTIKNRDLTEEKRKVEDVNKELETFSYSVSHDLRAPLRHINGFTSLLQNKLKNKLDEKEESYFNNIISSSLKMNQLIDDLLIYSRLGRTALNKAPVNMKNLVETVLQTFIFDIKKYNISIRVDDLPNANADTFFMAQMWENLISNAIKFSSKAKHPKIHIGFEKDTEDNIIYFIKDNGAGFDQNYVENIFGVFQRLHSVNEFPGTGIGLATTKRIIMKHDGDIWAEGLIDKGASFFFKLPKT